MLMPDQIKSFWLLSSIICLSISLPFFFLSYFPWSFPFLLLSTPTSSSVKDRHQGTGGQALAHLSNHYLCSFSSLLSFFSPPSPLTSHLSAAWRPWPSPLVLWHHSISQCCTRALFHAPPYPDSLPIDV